MCKLNFCSWTFAFLLFAASGVFAQNTINPEIISQLKNLPKDQQLILARSYGIDPQLLGIPNQQRFEDEMDEGFELEQMEPRDLSGDASFELDFLNYLQKLNEEEEDEGLTRFGIEFFDEEITTLSQLATVAVPESYVLGVGDYLKVVYMGAMDQEVELRIQSDGSMTIPRVGVVTLVGMTFGEAKALIEGKISSQLAGVKGFVSMGKLKNINVYITGEVKRPGSYSLSGITTLTQALYVGGGISDIGSLRNVVLKRSGKTILSYDLYDLLLRGDRSKDVQLDSGDVIFVPVARKLVSIDGEVRRPAIYEIKNDETLKDALQIAGNASSKAYRSRATIKQFDKRYGQPRIINLNLDDEEKMLTELVDGDEIILGQATEEIVNPISLSGAVIREGVYAWEQNNTVSDYIGSIQQDLKPDADLNVGLIVRRKNIKLEIEVIPFNIYDAVTQPGSDLDPVLLSHDQLLIFPLADSQKELLLSASGKDFSQKIRKNNQNQLDSNRDLSSEENANLEEDLDREDSVRIRKELLEPVIKKLKSQANLGNPAEIVSINGAVRIPGEYPLLASGDMRYLTALAGGYDDGAYLKEVEIRRIDVDLADGVKTRFLKIDLSQTGENIELRSRDLIRINYLPDWNPDESVELRGEVRFPGTYAITKGETLGSILARAGGVTDKAYVKGLKYFSSSTRELQRERAQRLLRRYDREQASRRSVGLGDLGESDDEQQREAVQQSLVDAIQGRLVVDVPRILAGDKSADIVLQNGDLIDVPIYVESVAVVGEVFEPGAFRYSADRSIEDYLSLAAGVTKRGSKGSIYVIDADGSVTSGEEGTRRWLSFRSVSVENNRAALSPGAVIVVPTNYDYQPLLQKYTSVTSVVFQSVTSLAALLSISNGN